MSRIVCFGEVLWDVFHNYKKIGGAPLNVALRLNSFGNHVNIVSSVGNDSDGKEIINFIEENAITSQEVQVNEAFKTSHVKVVLDKNGSASYNIEFPCAWDYIELRDSTKEIVKKAGAFIFGSLITRNEVSRNTLFSLLKLANFKVFDVNLRAPHYTMSLLEKLMNVADFIKFNDEELLEICEYYNFKSEDLEDNIIFISKKTNTEHICVTLGGNGAVFYTNDTFFKSSGYKVAVKDTVGAGDSFLATLIDGILKNNNPKTSIDYACAVGALVASKDGANPKIKTSDIDFIINQ
ncbi:carbohydrate kinase [Flaviramulus sp. BrNp1-15]|uniref:carbohydrate kinase family protein n=1 Tax=Flaviramulus sp. BrNp1-15 TaxID=2916754 RepID=UPI001EE954A4|nr:carbohydrate kinase [Flaviramulus sp. BrNp1-15]ULC59064.1 carbohydrate kinase [Flaviramulus sp. BrNp1-15]